MGLGHAGRSGLRGPELRAHLRRGSATGGRRRPIAEFVGRFHPDDLPGFQRELDRVIAEDGTFRSEYRIRQADGSTRWFLAQGSIIRDEAGAPDRFPGVSIDITDRKREETQGAAFLQLGDRLRDLDDPEAMAAVASEIIGTTLAVGRAGYGTIEPTRETINIAGDWNAPGNTSLAGTLRFRDFGSYIDDLKRDKTVVCPDVDADDRTAATADALRTIGTQAFINMPLFEHGAFVALLFVTSAEKRAWTADEVDFMRGVADRTRAAIERARAERELRQLAASLELLVAQRTADRNRIWSLSADLMIVLRFDGTITDINPAWTSSLGWMEQNLLGRSFFDLVHPDEREQTIEAMRLVAIGDAVPLFVNRLRSKDGDSYRWIAWQSVASEALIHAVGRDISAEREQAEALAHTEEQLRQAQKMEAVGQLTGGLAHDFNNLLTGITGSLDLLGLRVTQGRIKDLDRYIHAAQGAARRAAALTHRLLAFSRRQTLDPKPTDINRLVHGMAELIRRTVGPSISLEVVGAAGLWAVMVDPNQLENALLNLCINARDAMPNGGRLTIETANMWLDKRAGLERDLSPGQFVTLCVTDTGTGMPPEVAKRAFDPFFTTKPLGEGTGLGLSMIYGFARQSDGQVRIYSEVGQGTTVCLYLPRHFGAAERDEAPLVRQSPKRAEHGETVLIVDDEPTVRMLVTEVLEDLGYTALEASDGVAGLRILSSDTRIDLLITDVGLPGGLNGRQVADAGRVKRPDLQVLFITGYAENAVVGNGHLDPGMRIMTKPFAMDALADTIKEMIAKR